MSRFTFIGVEGSGKTVLMAALADAFGPPTAEGMNLIPENQTAFTFSTLIPHKMREEHQWPAATSITSMKHLEWSLRIGTEVISTFSMLDYPGELYRLAFGDRNEDELAPHRDQIHEFLEHLVTSDTLIVLLNLEDAMAMGANARNNETVWLTRSIFDYVQKLPNIKKQLLLFTQADRYAEEISGTDGLMNAKSKYLPMLHALYPNLECASVSVATDEENAPGHDFSKTHGIADLLRWIMLQTDIGRQTENRLTDIEPYIQSSLKREISTANFHDKTKILDTLPDDLCEILKPGKLGQLRGQVVAARLVVREREVVDLKAREEQLKVLKAADEERVRKENIASLRKRIDVTLLECKKIQTDFAKVDTIEDLNRIIQDYHKKLQFLTINGVSGIDVHDQKLKQMRSLCKLETSIIHNNSKSKLAKRKTWKSLSKQFTYVVFQDQISAMHTRYHNIHRSKLITVGCWAGGFIVLLVIIQSAEISRVKNLESARIAAEERAESERIEAEREAEAARIAAAERAESERIAAAERAEASRIVAAKRAAAERVRQEERSRREAAEKTRIESLRQQAENGDAVAQWEYGNHYSRSNAQLAVMWWSRAAEKGHLEAQLHMAKNSDHQTAKLRWYRLAANQGSAEAQLSIAKEIGFQQNRLLNKNFLESNIISNYNEAMQWLRMAAIQGEAEAQYWVGIDCENQSSDNYRNNLTQLQRTAKRSEAIQWHQRAARQGYKDAQDALRRLGHAW